MLAFAAWTTRIGQHDIRVALDAVLCSAGFSIEDVGTTALQVSALKRPEFSGDSFANVRLVALWENKDERRLRIELRSDEPTLRPHTLCSETAEHLQALLPPD